MYQIIQQVPRSYILKHTVTHGRQDGGTQRITPNLYRPIFPRSMQQWKSYSNRQVIIEISSFLLEKKVVQNYPPLGCVFRYSTDSTRFRFFGRGYKYLSYLCRATPWNKNDEITEGRKKTRKKVHDKKQGVYLGSLLWPNSNKSTFLGLHWYLFPSPICTLRSSSLFLTIFHSLFFLFRVFILLSFSIAGCLVAWLACVMSGLRFAFGIPWPAI